MALIPAVRALRHHREAAAKVLPSSLHRYLDDIVFPSGWYDEDELLGLLEGLVAILPPRPDIWEWLGARGARDDFSTVYSAFVQARRPDVTIGRYDRVWRLYHDNGRAETQIDVDRLGGQITILGDMVEHESFCRLQTGHFHALLEMSRAEGVTVEWLGIAQGAEPARWRCRWASVDES